VRTVEFVDGDLGADAIDDEAFALRIELSPEPENVTRQTVTEST
jgi:hypothetical protein